jgi:hypothetical protein
MRQAPPSARDRAKCSRVGDMWLASKTPSTACHVFHRTEGALGESETNQHAPAVATVLVAAPAAALTLATVPRTPSATWLLAPPRAAWCANTLSRQCLRAQS